MNNDKIIYDIAIANGFTPKSALFVIAQSRLESSDYKSNVYKNNNNGFGMKFIGQPLATKGTLVPVSERVRPITANINYYAKYNTFQDSVKDAVQRLFNITKNGVTPQMLKNATTSVEYANLQKTRGYFGGTALAYSKMINAKMKKIDLGSNNASLNVMPLIVIFLSIYLYKLLTNKS